jgi:hypothetical protein
MSLLIKALKKAEQKHLEATALALEQVSLDPTVIAAAKAIPIIEKVPAAEAASIQVADKFPTLIPELETHVLSIEAAAPMMASITPEATPPTTVTAPATEDPMPKEPAFQEKKKVPKPSKISSQDVIGASKLKRWLPLGIVITAAVATAGGYLYWQTMRVPQAPSNSASSPLALDLTQGLDSKSLALATKTSLSDKSDPAPSTSQSQGTAQVRVAPITTRRPANPDDNQGEVRLPKSEPQIVDLKPDAVINIKPASVPIPGPRLVRNDSNDRVTRLLEQAFTAQSSQDKLLATQLYDQVLEIDKNNLDALLGRAAMHAKNGDAASATRLYGRVLELEPNDSSAKAALASLRTSVDPEGQESNLRNLLAKDPTQPSLLFALGNALAAQGRWSEAQAVYFQAYSGDNQQPDYAFNLAVSLERLRQNSLALNYYRSALELTQTKSARFKAAHVRQRIAALEKPNRVEITDITKE